MDWKLLRRVYVFWFIILHGITVWAQEEDFRICETCKCENSNPFEVDCSNRGLTEQVSDADWPRHPDIHSIEATFDHNRLTEIVSFRLNLSVTSLSFRYNQISEIANNAFYHFNELTLLDLSFNNLTYESIEENTFYGRGIGDDLHAMKLEQLSLAHNNIHSLHEDAFENLPLLKQLDVSHNPFEMLDMPTQSALTSLRKLEALNLDSTKLSSLPNGLLHSLPNLQVLILSGNNFVQVPVELRNAHALTSLNLNVNPIVELNKGDFEGLDKVKELNISSMPKLKKINEYAFSSLHSLKIIRCEVNQNLKSIDKNAFQGIAKDDLNFPVRELYLSRNALPSLPFQLVPWSKLLVINIEDNPWRCDCKLEWLATHLLEIIERKTPEYTMNLLCAEPPSLRSQSLEVLALEPKQFQCGKADASLQDDEPLYYEIQSSTTTVAALLAIMAVLLAITIGVGLTLARRRRHFSRAFPTPRQTRYTRASTEEEKNPELTTEESGEPVDVLTNVEEDKQPLNPVV